MKQEDLSKPGSSGPPSVIIYSLFFLNSVLLRLVFDNLWTWFGLLMQKHVSQLFCLNLFAKETRKECAWQHDRSDRHYSEVRYWCKFCLGGFSELNKGKVLPQLPVFLVLCCRWQVYYCFVWGFLCGQGRDEPQSCSLWWQHSPVICTQK